MSRRRVALLVALCLVAATLALVGCGQTRYPECDPEGYVYAVPDFRGGWRECLGV